VVEGVRSKRGIKGCTVGRGGTGGKGSEIKEFARGGDLGGIAHGYNVFSWTWKTLFN